MRLIRSAVFCTVVLLVGVPASAQVETVLSRDVGIFLAGVDPANGGQPISAPVNYPTGATVCGQAKVTVTSSVTNPNEVRINDPADSTKDCVLASASTQLAATPFGTGFRVASRTRGATTVSAWSALSNPFDRAGLPPATDTNVRVR